jgi:sugar lactone lactonase YvrE
MKTILRFLIRTLVLLSLLATLRAQTVSRVATFGPAESPESIAVDAAGNCYLSCINTGEIKRVTPAGVISLFATIPEPGPSGKAIGVKFDAAGMLYVASASAVWKVTPAGVVSQFATVPGHTILNDFAFDRNGNVFVSDPRGFAIYKVAPNGETSRSTGTAMYS